MTLKAIVSSYDSFGSFLPLLGRDDFEDLIVNASMRKSCHCLFTCHSQSFGHRWMDGECAEATHARLVDICQPEKLDCSDERAPVSWLRKNSGSLKD